MKKAIVTGANSFVGSNLIRELLSNNVHVIAIVRNKSSDISNISDLKHVEIMYCDLKDIGQISLLVDEVDVFYHFAWDGSSGSKRADYNLQLQNIAWTIECLKVAQKIGCKRFVGVGSIMEKETLFATYSQGNKLGSPYIYGIAKATAHSICKALASELEIEFIWTFITNAYGPGEVSPRFINTTLRKVISNTPLKFTSATQNYDFIYIKDAARAFYLVGLNGQPNYEYVIGSGSAGPLKNYILQIKESVALEQDFEFGNVPFVGVNIPIEEFSTQLLLEHTGFKTQTTFHEGINLTYIWLKSWRGRMSYD